MTAERRELKLVRESLESVVSPEVAAAVLFDALDLHEGPRPSDAASLVAFVGGALRSALRTRLGPAAESVADELSLHLGLVLPAAASPPRRWDRVTTREVLVNGRPVRVLVVSGHAALADKLMACLGEPRVSPVAVTTPEILDAQSHLGLHAIVLIDAADFAPIEPSMLASRLASMDSTVLRIVWGGELPYGAALLRAMADRDAVAHAVDRREGFEPLLDLIRSRHARPGPPTPR
jgi:hypothetical protein